jgi:hypothetical protein
MVRGWIARWMGGVATLVACTSLSGCLVMGYSSGGGFWILPGSLVITVLLLIWFLMNRR